MATSANPGGSFEKSNSTESMDVSDPPGPKVNLCRRESGILQITQPLYQEYSHQALDREIQRQRRDERSASPSPEGRRGGGRRATGVRASLIAPLGLWRDVPEVRASRWFSELSAEMQRLQEVKFELISSEASYLRSLDIAVDHFQSSETLMSLLTTQERQWLFSKLPAVREVSRRFLSELEENFEENMLDFDVCRILLSLLPDFRSVYIPYVTNQSYQEKIFKNLIHKDPNFLRAVETLESHEVCQRLTLKSFLILPFQRITRLRLLVQNILQRSTRGSQDEETARMAAEALGELMRECNEKVQRMKSTEQLIALSRMIDFESKIFPLISESRRLVKQGELTEVGVAGGNISWRRGTSRSLYLHLFNDYLLLSRHKENGRFSVFDHTFSHKVVVENVKVRPPCAHRFLLRLTLVTNQHGKLREHHLKAHTQSEKLRWISALTPIKEEIDLTQYYGSRQVQCLKRYRARQYDELQLEKADILIVTQECEDGWEEGFRLSDGDRGWFPSTHVQTIVSQRARARNIEDRLRLNRPS